jgi:competence protein ComEC
MRIPIGVIAQISLLLATIAIHQLSALPMGLLFVLQSITVAAAVLLVAVRYLGRYLGRYLSRNIANANYSIPRLVLWTVLFSSMQATIVTYRAQERLSAVIPAGLDGTNFRLVGVIDSLPSQYERGIGFEFLVQRCLDEQRQARNEGWCPLNKVVKLSWFNGAPMQLMPGQRWELTARLRRPYARMNPFLFDAELRMFEQGITAQGSVRVREATPAQMLEDLVALHQGKGIPWWIERARFRLRESIQAAVSTKEYFLLPAQDFAVSKISVAVAGILVALVVGDQGAIASTWWTVFNQTGVGHLMSISGLHVTMMAGFVASIAVSIWKVSAVLSALLFGPMRCEALPSKQSVRWGAAILGAWLYTALAGFGIPAQRTCWMVTLAGLTLLSGRSGSATSVILFTAAAITFIDPWAVLSAGFWLSFGAVSAIIYFGGAKAFNPNSIAKNVQIAELSRLKRLLTHVKNWTRDVVSNGWQSQVAATLSLLPVGAAFFSSFALLSPVANAIAIPVVSALVTPLAMLGALLLFIAPTAFGEGILWLGASLTAPLLQWLQWLASLPNSVAILGKPNPAALLLGMMAMLLLLAPHRVIPVRVRLFGVMALCPVVLQTPQAPPQGQTWLTVFDVGQGSALLVETNTRRLLFDLGPNYGADADAGSAVVGPYLKARGLTKLDAIVLSHEDRDHTGGLKSVLSSFDVGWIASSIPRTDATWQVLEDKKQPNAKNKVQFFECKRGDIWHWDGVSFEFLHPDSSATEATKASKKIHSNSRSCVLKITAKGVSALITADIETGEEKRLLKHFSPSVLKADFLIAPNHGSKKASSEAFLAAVDPKVAIFQVGFRNRLKYPDANVVERYKQMGVSMLRTDELGAVKVQLPSGAVSFERNRDSPYWRTRLSTLSLSNTAADSTEE